MQFAAGYVNRILNGEYPGELPVQAPTKYELVINLQDCHGVGPYNPTDSACPRRRGDRMTALCCDSREGRARARRCGLGTAILPAVELI
jgi:hypothetical protein